MGIPLANRPVGALLTDVMFSPGAAMPTQGPAMVNDDGCPPGVREPTESTYGCHHDGIETEVALDQFRGSEGRAGSGQGVGFAGRPGGTAGVPAAATTTTSLSTAAYRSAAPSSL